MKKSNRKKRGSHLIVGAVVFIMLLFAGGYLIDRSTQAAQQPNSGSQAEAGGAAGAAKETGRQPETLEADLIIPTEDVTDEVKFYPVTVDDTEMEVLAVKASDGTMRTAFNTCQICFSSGRGYYKQTEYGLQCQNCGNMFSVDEVEVEIGGCNPWPIFDENKTVDETNITIPLAFLQESAAIFQNWRV